MPASCFLAQQITKRSPSHIAWWTFQFRLGVFSPCPFRRKTRYPLQSLLRFLVFPLTPLLPLLKRSVNPARDASRIFPFANSLTDGCVRFRRSTKFYNLPLPKS